MEIKDLEQKLSKYYNDIKWYYDLSDTSKEDLFLYILWIAFKESGIILDTGVLLAKLKENTKS